MHLRGGGGFFEMFDFKGVHKAGKARLLGGGAYMQLCGDGAPDVGSFDRVHRDVLAAKSLGHDLQGTQYAVVRSATEVLRYHCLWSGLCLQLGVCQL
jgi:hypothetical protein